MEGEWKYVYNGFPGFQDESFFHKMDITAESYAVNLQELPADLAVCDFDDDGRIYYCEGRSFMESIVEVLFQERRMNMIPDLPYLPERKRNSRTSISSKRETSNCHYDCTVPECYTYTFTSKLDTMNGNRKIGEAKIQNILNSL